MNWKLFVAAASLTLASTLPLSAQTTRVAYVDIDRVTEKSDRINKAMGTVSEKVEGIQKDIETKRRRAADLKAEIKKGEGVLADAELKKRREESAKLEKEVTDLEYEARRELQKLDTTLFEPMIKTIVLAIEEVAKERNVELVLRGEAVIYAANAADLTDEVVKKLNSPSFNPDAASGSSSKTGASGSRGSSASKASSDNSEKPSTSSSSAKNTPASKSEDSTKAKSETASTDAAGENILPSIPLRTRPVDRQAE